MNLKIKGWDKIPEQRKQKFFMDLESVLNKYELFGVFE